MSYFQSIHILILEDWRKRFPTVMAFVGEGAGLALGLVIYWYTSRAFGTGGIAQALHGLAPDYFSYILLSDTTLILPLAVMTGFLTTIRDAKDDGTLDEIRLLPSSLKCTVFLLASPCIPRELFRALLTFALAALFFGFALPLDRLTGWILIEFASLPVFAGFGMIAASVFLVFGRGQGALAFLTMAGTLLGGAYFPLRMLPESVQKFSNILSPFRLVLETPRTLFYEGWSHSVTQGILGLGAWGVVFFALGWVSLTLALTMISHRGSAESFSS